jgi:hypothetical protein
MADWIAAARKSYVCEFVLLRDSVQYLSVLQAYVDLSVIIPISILRHLYPAVRSVIGRRG